MCDYDEKIRSQHWRTLQLMKPAFETIIKSGCDIDEDHERLMLTEKELTERGKHETEAEHVKRTGRY
jgi:hypothetical protein